MNQDENRQITAFLTSHTNDHPDLGNCTFSELVGSFNVVCKMGWCRIDVLKVYKDLKFVSYRTEISIRKQAQVLCDQDHGRLTGKSHKVSYKWLWLPLTDVPFMEGPTIAETLESTMRTLPALIERGDDGY